MELRADLHLHSKYSRAVSRQMVVSEIAAWAEKKGIDLVATGDWTHPLWLRELRQNLEEKQGILELKGQPTAGSRIKFLLSTEISSIYTDKGKSRRIHNLVLAPSFTAVEQINEALRRRGANLLSDGRPIIGLSAEELTELVLTIEKNCLVIPAHVWTPWFSLYGSQSGFDSINECFGEMADKILAVETGLSSDPGMNWQIEELENRAIVSFSDAHSLAKIGRELTVFEVEDKNKFGYQDILKAVREKKISHTIEFYPEEGKYHFTGHRNCRIRQSPDQTKKLGETCPVCGKHLTVGVMHRVNQLADPALTINPEINFDSLGVKWLSKKGKPSYLMLVPLMEILAESLGTSPGSQKVVKEFEKLIDRLGTEFTVLLNAPIEAVAQVSGPRVAEGIKKVRGGEIVIDPGYDGVFGTVKIWPIQDPKTAQELASNQMAMF